MAVTIPGNSGYAAQTITNEDPSAVAALQSTNSGQPAGAAFNQFQGVVSGDQDALQSLSNKISSLQATPNLSADQQKELLSDVQQYEQGSEKFKSDNAHLLQLASADQSSPEAFEAVTMGNAQATNMKGVALGVSSFVHSSSSGVSPSIASAVDASGSSIIDQANAIRWNTYVPTGPGASVGSGNSDRPSEAGISSGAQVNSQGSNFNLPSVSPSTVSDLQHANANQPQGQAFASFSKVVQDDQAQLNGLASSLNSKSPDFTATLQKYEKASEKFVGDQAHLLQLGTADNSSSEVIEARAFAAAQHANMATIASAAGNGANAVATSSGSLTDNALAVRATASSINDQATALDSNNAASV